MMDFVVVSFQASGWIRASSLNTNLDQTYGAQPTSFGIRMKVVELMQWNGFFKFLRLSIINQESVWQVTCAAQI